MWTQHPFLYGTIFLLFSSKSKVRVVTRFDKLGNLGSIVWISFSHILEHRTLNKWFGINTSTSICSVLILFNITFNGLKKMRLSFCPKSSHSNHLFYNSFLQNKTPLNLFPGPGRTMASASWKYQTDDSESFFLGLTLCSEIFKIAFVTYYFTTRVH